MRLSGEVLVQVKERLSQGVRQRTYPTKAASKHTAGPSLQSSNNPKGPTGPQKRTLAARRTNSAFSGQISWYASPLRLNASRAPPG